MTSKTFTYGLLVTFGVPWLALLAVPSYRMANMEPPKYVEAIDGLSGVFVPKRGGEMTTGFTVYKANGCATCHSQLIRTTDASGADMWRVNWAGKVDETGDTRRETRWWDFLGEDVAPIGYMRVGPDLSNLAVRIKSDLLKEFKERGEELDLSSAKDRATLQNRAKERLFVHLYNPRDKEFRPEVSKTSCDAHPELFEKRKIGTSPSEAALPFSAEPDYEWLPTEKADRLVSYLLSLDRDDKLPAEASYQPKKEDKGDK